MLCIAFAPRRCIVGLPAAKAARRPPQGVEHMAAITGGADSAATASTPRAGQTCRGQRGAVLGLLLTMNFFEAMIGADIKVILTPPCIILH